MSTITLPEPIWLRDMPPGEEREKARLGWLLDICAIYASRDGKMTSLSLALKKDASTVGKAKSLGQLSPRLCIEIEKLLGRDVMPREVLCPAFFAIEG